MGNPHFIVTSLFSCSIFKVVIYGDFALILILQCITSVLTQYTFIYYDIYLLYLQLTCRRSLKYPRRWCSMGSQVVIYGEAS